MADYFEEMGWKPLGDGEAPNHLLHIARLLRDFGFLEGMQENKRLPPPASKEVVKNLIESKHHIVENSGMKCPVCLTEHGVGDKVITLPCSHGFHDECILPWLDVTNSCPLCRYEMPTDDEDYEMYRKEKIRAKERENDIENLHNSMFS